MTLTEYEHYHHYDIWSIDLDDESGDECVGYVKTVWEDEREIDDQIELLNENSCRYQYFFKLA